MSQNNKYLDAIDNVLNVAQLAVPAVIPGANAARYFSSPQGYQNLPLHKNINTVFNVDRLAKPVAMADTKASHFLTRPEGFQNKSLYKKLEDTTNGIYQGFTAGFSDELNGLGKGMVYGMGDGFSSLVDRSKHRGDGTFLGGFKRGYSEGRDSSRADYDASLQRSPVLVAMGEKLGGFANSVLFNRQPNNESALSPLQQMLMAAQDVAIDGPITNIGKSRADTLSETMKDAAIKSALSLVPVDMLKMPYRYVLRQNKLDTNHIKKTLDSGIYKGINFKRTSKGNSQIFDKIRKIGSQMQNTRPTLFKESLINVRKKGF